MYDRIRIHTFLGLEGCAFYCIFFILKPDLALYLYFSTSPDSKKLKKKKSKKNKKDK